MSDEKERWYCVTTGGLATLCKDKSDALAQVAESDMAYPRQGPHRAVRLIDAAEVEALRAEVSQARRLLERVVWEVGRTITPELREDIDAAREPNP